MKLAADINATKVNFVADSLQAVDWITKNDIDEHFLPNELLSCRSLLRTFQDWSLTWTTRGSNTVANDLAGEARRTSRSVFFMNPLEIQPFVSQRVREELLVSQQDFNLSKASHGNIYCNSNRYRNPRDNKSFCIGNLNCRPSTSSSHAYRDVGMSWRAWEPS